MAAEIFSDQLEQLQSQLAFQEDTIHALNDVVAAQGQDIRLLNRKVELLIGQLQGISESMGEVAPNERPPHY